MSTTPMPGFHYVDFAGSSDGAGGFATSNESDDLERIAEQFSYCFEAVRQWPGFRRFAERKGLLAREACEGIEHNAIAIFREFVDVVSAAIEADNLRPISEVNLCERLAHAHAYLAIHAAHENLADYWKDFSSVFDVPIGDSDPDGFAQAVWEASWNSPGEKTPTATTFRVACEHKKERLGDGLTDSRGKRRKIAQRQLVKASCRMVLLQRSSDGVAQGGIDGIRALESNSHVSIP